MLRGLAVAASALVLLGTGIAWRTVGSLDAGLATTRALGLGGGGIDDTHADGATDILLVGTDSRTDAQGNPLSQAELDELRAGDVATTNTDTIILVRVPDGGGSATAMSIPRDSYVAVPDGGRAKINGVYGSAKQEKADAMVAAGADPARTEQPATEAGRQALISTVQSLTGVTVDHYAEIGLLGFVLLTDAVDGVQVCLRNPVDEPLSGARFPAGEQTLDGADALSFVRQRHDLPRGDLDRIRRQQAFMASLAGKVLSAGSISPGRLGALSDALRRSVVIDDSWDLLGFAQQLQGLAGGKVTFATVPVVNADATGDDGESVVDVDPTAVRAAAAAAIGRAPAPPPATSSTPPVPVQPGTPVQVANASGVEGLAGQVATALGGLGYTVGAVGNSPGGDRAESAVTTADPSDAGAAAVASALGGLPVQTDDSLPAGAVRVLVGTDYAGPGSSASAATTGGAGSTGTTSAAPEPAPDPIAAAPDPRCVD